MDNDNSIRMNDSIINSASHLKYLGVIKDSKLNWILHITYVKNKISKGIGIIHIYIYIYIYMIVVMMGRWSDDSACWVVHDVLLYNMLYIVVISSEDVCYSVVFVTLLGVYVFNVIWSELLMASAINCPLWSSVYECQRVE